VAGADGMGLINPNTLFEKGGFDCRLLMLHVSPRGSGRLSNHHSSRHPSLALAPICLQFILKLPAPSKYSPQRCWTSGRHLTRVGSPWVRPVLGGKSLPALFALILMRRS
jgi:hypothetical protein